MKRLLLASILMAFGPSAHAVVTVGVWNCIGAGTDTSCTADLTCTGGNCGTDSVLAASNNCAPLPIGSETGVTQLIAANEGENPVCAWDVTDIGGDDLTTRVIVDGSDGLPVELQSLSIE